MKLETAKKVLALQRLEEADVFGNFLAPEERLAATTASGLMEIAGKGEWSRAHDEALERRTNRLLRDERVASRVREVMGEARPVRGRVVAVAMAIGALLLGALTNEVGGDRVINLLSIPMLGLLIWNFLVYTMVMVAKLRGKKPQGEGHGPHRWLNRWLLKGAGVTIESKGTAERPPEGSVAAVVWEARTRFWHRWVRVLRTEAAYWSEIVFHVGAAALATGIVGGMYIRGLAFEYNAAWESTFLKAPEVTRALRLSLGPAAVLLRQEIPKPDKMQRLNIHDQNKLAAHERESAAKWIHLYAATAVLFIGLPRLGLVAVAGLTVRRFHDYVPITKDLRHYFEGLVRQASGRELVAHVVGFAHDVDEHRRDEIRGLLHRMWPSVAQIGFLAVPYGGEEEWLAEIEIASGPGKKATDAAADGSAEIAGSRHGPVLAPRVGVLMNFSVTPEDEVHGYFVRELLQRLLAAGDKAGYAVILDTAPFRQQLGGLPEFERRLRERRVAWERLIDGIMDAALSEEHDFYVWRSLSK
ncbi:MAG: hypothetical protein ACR2OZ_00740 [Verrucomicrobiales bacterium]